MNQKIDVNTLFSNTRTTSWKLYIQTHTWLSSILFNDQHSINWRQINSWWSNLVTCMERDVLCNSALHLITLCSSPTWYKSAHLRHSYKRWWSDTTCSFLKIDNVDVLLRCLDNRCTLIQWIDYQRLQLHCARLEFCFLSGINHLNLRNIA